jgi:hypothetical protein
MALNKRQSLIACATLALEQAGRTLGARFLRRGRFAAATTDQAGTIIYVHADSTLQGASAMVGPAAFVANNGNIPATLKALWQGATNDETDDDPNDAPAEFGAFKL